MSFEAWIYHPQIKTLTEVARECPDVKIVLNHFGGPLGVGPYNRDEVFPGWRRRHQGPVHLPERVREARRVGHDRQRLRFSLGAAAAVIG